MSKKSDRSRARLFFMRGIASLLPTILTIVILVICYRFVRDNIATPINQGIHHLLVNTAAGRDILERYGGVELDIREMRYRVRPAVDWKSFRKPDSERVDREELTAVLNQAIHPILGFMIAILLIFVIGFLFASYLGRRVFARFELLVSKFPIVKIIYPYAKQLVDFFFKEEKKMDYSAVIAFEYPRKGIWAIGFMTGHGLRQLHEHAGRRLASVVVPSSPAPMTGYTVFVPVEDVVALDIDVEEAFRLIITGGVVVPDSQLVSIDAPPIAPELGAGAAEREGAAKGADDETVTTPEKKRSAKPDRGPEHRLPDRRRRGSEGNERGKPDR